MPGPDELNPRSLFKRTLDECRELYVSSGRLCAQEFPDRLPQGGDKFVELMDDLHRALLVKVYFTVCEADRKWSEAERYLAEVLFDHLWNQRLTGEKLRTAARQTAQDASKLKWYAWSGRSTKSFPSATASARWKRLSCGWPTWSPGPMAS